MRIRKTTLQDLNRVMEIYMFARKYMAQHGNPNQWGPTNWPPEALIRNDIAEGNSYVCENDTGKVIGTFFFTQGPDIEPTYREITDGKWLNSSPYGVVHRIASDGSEKGTGTFCINWAYNRCGHLRIDTHGDNTVMQNLLRKLGFVHCGTIYVKEDNAPRLAYEKSESEMMNDCRQRLAEFIERETEYWDFWGAIRIIKNGKILWETSRGYSCAEFGVKNTMATRFTIASVTKQFTAFAVMLLYDRGLLSPDADANTYLPEDMQIPAGITVHHLLSHTSGLYNFYNFEDDFYIGEDRLPYDRKAFLSKWILKQPMNPPGESFSYNNSNYNLLAWIIEYVSKQSYSEFLRDNIFLPLGMVNTGFDNGMAVLESKANNYMHDYGITVRVPYVNNLFLMGAGALISNCDDLQKWYDCLKHRKLLSEKAYQRFFDENLNHYCYGLERHHRNGITMYAHGGDANGIAAYTQYFFEDDICIIILSNNESLNQYRLGEGIAAILYGKEPKHAVRPDEVPVSEAELRQFTGTYLPGKIQIEMKNGKLYLVRVNQNIHIELYCIGLNTFIRRHEEQSYTHHLLPEGSEKPVVWGYELNRP